MAKPGGSRGKNPPVVELNARVRLTRDKIHRFLMDDGLREAAEALAREARLVRRLRDGTTISGVWIEPGGPVFTSVRVTGFTMEGRCSCAAQGPCLHAGALALVCLEDPDGFLDLDRWLEDLGSRPHGEVLDLLRTVMASIPAAMELARIPGFEGVITAEAPDGDTWWEEGWDEESPAEDIEECLTEAENDPPPDPEEVH